MLAIGECTHSAFIEESYFYNERYQRSNNCKIGDTLHGRLIIAEFSLQSVSQNSRENNQQQSLSQIREK
jgi:hypothetical protein